MPGLNEVAVEEQPPVAIVFWSFRIMVGIGVLMILFALAGLVLRAGGRLYKTRWYLQGGMRFMSIAPFFAVLTGWFVTEVGRAPWLVYGMMTQAESVTPSLTGGMALFTLIGYIVVYAWCSVPACITSCGCFTLVLKMLTMKSMPLIALPVRSLRPMCRSRLNPAHTAFIR